MVCCDGSVTSWPTVWAPQVAGMFELFLGVFVHVVKISWIFVHDASRVMAALWYQRLWENSHVGQRYSDLVAIRLSPILYCSCKYIFVESCRIDKWFGGYVYSPFRPSRLLGVLSWVLQRPHWLQPTLRSGQTIITQGDVGREFFIIQSGEAEVMVSDGGSQHLGFLCLVE